MQHFYRHWTSGVNVDDALTLAKKAMQQSKEYNKPYYWQGYVLEGNPYIKLGR